MSLKQLFVGTQLGSWGMYLRNQWSMINACWVGIESIGTLANDLLASKLVIGICSPGRAFVDVGAHIGSVSGEVLRLGFASHVIALEAIPEKAAALRRVFPRLEVIECAVGDREDLVSFFIDDKLSGFSSMVPGQSRVGRPVREIKVQVRCLDDIILRDDVDVIKIDVEGAELGVIRGASRILRECRPIIVFESGPDSGIGLGYTTDDLYDALSGIGYTVHVPNRVAHLDQGLTKSAFLESHTYPRRCTNYVAIPAERREQVRKRARLVIGLPSCD